MTAAVIAVAGALGALISSAQAQPAARQVVSDHWSTQTPGASAGRSYAVMFVDPAHPGGKPPGLSHVHLQLPAGAHFDTDAIAHCTADDATLMASGAGACPAASKLGTMAITLDSGFPGPARYLHATVTFLNNRNQLIFLAQDDSSGARTVTRGTVTSTTLDTSLPLLPGTPPDGAADSQERGAFAAASSARGNYLTTPPSCPATGEWVEQETYTYHDGVTQTVAISEPCARPQAGRGVHRHGHRVRKRRHRAHTRHHRVHRPDRP